MIGVVKLSRSETWSHERVDYRYVRQLSSYHGDLTLGALPDTIFFLKVGGVLAVRILAGCATNAM
jgi:hypothetical protein